MTTIFKFKLADHITESFIKVPLGAIFISLAVQFNEAVAYFVVSDLQKETKTFDIYAATTGGICPPSHYTFLGTAILNGGNYVLHYYINYQQ